MVSFPSFGPYLGSVEVIPPSPSLSRRLLLTLIPQGFADTPSCHRVDPDALARALPEREQYLRADHKTASKMLHPEAALLQEILSAVAKTQRRSLVIDGSLSDCGWFGKLMHEYQEDGYDCEILFVASRSSSHTASLR